MSMLSADEHGTIQATLITSTNGQFSRWEQRFRLYMTAKGASAKKEPVKIAIL